jgi:putative chitinase
MIDRAILEQLYPRASDAVLKAFAEQNGPLLGQFGISATALRLEFFLAQIGHESGGLTITAENMNYSAPRIAEVWPRRFPTVADALPYAHNPEKLANKVYSNRMGNGPPESGDGWNYRGRGLIQITGRDGYRSVGAIAGIDLEAQPARAAEPGDALLVACAFWEWKGLNALCDTGDFEKVTRRINGGTIGMADRLAWLDKVRRILSLPMPLVDQPTAEIVRKVQLALRARGFADVGAADGIVGPRTAAAIRRFRRENGLPDGLIDAQLLDLFAIAH